MNKLTLLSIALLATVAIVYAVETRGIGCSLCKDFVAEMEKELADGEGTLKEVSILKLKFTRYRIFQKADRVCDKLTKKHHVLDALCKELVNKGLDAIVKGIEKHETPEKICKDVDFC